MSLRDPASNLSLSPFAALGITANGNYSMADQNRIASLVDQGKATLGQAAQFYNVPMAQAQAAYDARPAANVQPLADLGITANGNYSMADQNRIASLVDSGQVNLQQAAQFYNVPMAQAQAAYDARPAPPQYGVAPPPYGLSAAQNALNQGAGAGLNVLGATAGQIANTTQQGVNNLASGGQLGLGILGGALGSMNNAYTGGQTAITKAGQDVNTALSAAQSALPSAFQGGYDSTGQLSPFVQRGDEAGKLQAALSGALGPAAQAQAYQNFQSSPGQEFLLQQGERALTRNAAATGGLGGGNVKRELVNFGQGMALQDLARQTGQMGEVAGRGLNAAGTSAGITSNLAGQQAGLGAQLSTANAQLAGQLGQSSAQLFGLQGAAINQLGQFGAGIPMEVGTAAADMRRNQATLESNLGYYGSRIPVDQSQLLSANAIQTGRDMEAVARETSTALAGQSVNLGAGTADLAGAQANNLSQLIQGAISGDVSMRLELGRLLANMSVSAGSSAAGTPIVPQGTTNTLGQLGQLASGVGGMMGYTPSTRSDGGAPIVNSIGRTPDQIRYDNSGPS